MWLVISGGPNNGHQKDKCITKIGLHAQNMLTILGSFFNMIEETYMIT